MASTPDPESSSKGNNSKAQVSAAARTARSIRGLNSVYDLPGETGDKLQGKLDVAWRGLFWKLRPANELGRKFLAEFFGTFVLVYFVLAQHFHGGQFGAFGGGLSVMFGMFSSIYVSGAHLNPVVSVTAFVTGRMAWKDMLVYIFAQYLGGFFAAAWLWCVYAQYFLGTMAGPYLGADELAGVFITQPKTFAVGIGTTILDQIMGGGMLLFYLFLINGDPQVVHIGKEFQCFFSGLYVMLLGLTMGYNVGGGINPARDLGPRIFAAIVASPQAAFKHFAYTFWLINIVSMHLGGIIFAAVLEIFTLNGMREE